MLLNTIPEQNNLAAVQTLGDRVPKFRERTRDFQAGGDQNKESELMFAPP